jgi:hypothetical protein
MKENPERTKFNKSLAELMTSQNDYVGDYVKSLMKDDGRAHVSVDLRRGYPIFEPYSSGHDLSNEIFSYVESVIKYTKVYSPVTVDFLVTPDQVPLENSIKTEFLGNYRFDYDEKREEVRRLRIKSVWLFIIGVFFLIGSMVLSVFGNQQNDLAIFFTVSGQVVSIVSWVFIWAAVEDEFFDRGEMNRQALRKAQLAISEINFVVEELPAANPSTKGEKQ